MPPDLRTVVCWIAKLGGFIGRRSDEEPGVKVIWRGLRRLPDSTAADIVPNRHPRREQPSLFRTASPDTSTSTANRGVGPPTSLYLPHSTEPVRLHRIERPPHGSPSGGRRGIEAAAGIRGSNGGQGPVDDALAVGPGGVGRGRGAVQR